MGPPILGWRHPGNPSELADQRRLSEPHALSDLLNAFGRSDKQVARGVHSSPNKKRVDCHACQANKRFLKDGSVAANFTCESLDRPYLKILRLQNFARAHRTLVSREMAGGS